MGEVTCAIIASQALLPGARVVAGPTGPPVGTQEVVEIVVTGVTAVLHVSRPRQACLGPRRFASVVDSSVPIVGLGATVGTVETRVPRAGLPGPATYFRRFR